MNIYTRKQWWKALLLLMAIAIGTGSLLYTNKLVKKLTAEEEKKVMLWAEAQREIANSDINQDITFMLKVVQDNETVPVIVVDADEKILFHRNLDSTAIKNPKKLEKKLAKMKAFKDPIVIELPDGYKQFIYYDISTILTKLIYYPYIQLTIILLFLAISYFAFSSSRHAEQNQVWVGMSKETAHQLGTPTSSLIAWIELLKLKYQDESLITDMEKDVKRLEKITERFSKIGSKPVLTNHNLLDIIQNVTNYLSARTSSDVSITVNSKDKEYPVMANASLLEWVFENLCKNAVDAMSGKGKININVKQSNKEITIDVSDTGKGIPKSKQKTVFKPGFTTKTRGWGLGLSLTKRIVEDNHGGKIFVSHSDSKGTVFRIILKK